MYLKRVITKIKIKKLFFETMEDLEKSFADIEFKFEEIDNKIEAKIKTIYKIYDLNAETINKRGQKETELKKYVKNLKEQQIVLSLKLDENKNHQFSKLNAFHETSLSKLSETQVDLATFKKKLQKFKSLITDRLKKCVYYKMLRRSSFY
jgi:hypothetical protein